MPESHWLLNMFILSPASGITVRMRYSVCCLLQIQEGADGRCFSREGTQSLVAPSFSSASHAHEEFLIRMECVICLKCVEVEKNGNRKSSWVVVNYCFAVGSPGGLLKVKLETLRWGPGSPWLPSSADDSVVNLGLRTNTPGYFSVIKAVLLFAFSLYLITLMDSFLDAPVVSSLQYLCRLLLFILLLF